MRWPWKRQQEPATTNPTPGHVDALTALRRFQQLMEEAHDAQDEPAQAGE